MPEISQKEKNRCKDIIDDAAKDASNAAVKLGALQHILTNFPWLDNKRIKKIHIKMIMEMGHIFDRYLPESEAEEWLNDFSREYHRRSAKQLALVLVPVVKTVVSSNSAKEITEKIGNMVMERFVTERNNEDNEEEG